MNIIYKREFYNVYYSTFFFPTCLFKSPSGLNSFKKNVMKMCLSLLQIIQKEGEGRLMEYES